MKQYHVDGAGAKLANTKKAERTFVAQAPAFLRKIRQERKPIARNAAQTAKKDFAKYLQHLLENARVALHPHVLTNELHKTRKTIKEILYLAGVKDSIDTRTLKFFKRLEELIGTWHDKQTILATLGRKHRSAPKLQTALEKDEKAIAKLAGKFYR